MTHKNILLKSKHLNLQIVRSQEQASINSNLILIWILLTNHLNLLRKCWANILHTHQIKQKDRKKSVRREQTKTLMLSRIQRTKGKDLLGSKLHKLSIRDINNQSRLFKRNLSSAIDDDNSKSIYIKCENYLL